MELAVPVVLVVPVAKVVVVVVPLLIMVLLAIPVVLVVLALNGILLTVPAGGEWFIEPGLPSIGDDLYDLLNPCVFENWWETAVGPIHPPGPPRGWLSTPRSHHRPFVAED